MLIEQLIREQEIKGGVVVGGEAKNTEINKQAKRWALPPGLPFCSDIRDANRLKYSGVFPPFAQG